MCLFVHVQVHLIINLTHYEAKYLQDASPNVTRYLVLARTANIPKEHCQYKVLGFAVPLIYISQSSVRWCKLAMLMYQTSIVFCLKEGPGTLYKALVAFWKRDLNLTKVILGMNFLLNFQISFRISCLQVEIKSESLTFHCWSEDREQTKQGQTNEDSGNWKVSNVQHITKSLKCKLITWICDLRTKSLWMYHPFILLFHFLGLHQPVRLAYQPPASSTFLSEQTSHQQSASSTFLSE
jgi:hypothetical protein